MEWDRYKTITTSILDTIGCTPLLELKRIPDRAGISARLLGKMEYYSPSGSLKDRIYMHMFDEAERRGDLKPGMTVIECSTGNAGISCAFMAAVKGYPCIIVMPEGMSEERKLLDMAYGAQMVYTPGGESDVDLALKKTAEIRESEPGKYWEPGQFSNPDNIDIHYKTTGPELWEQTGGDIDAFVATQGTGGTISGAGKYIQEQKPDIKLYAVEPAECPLLSQRRWGPHGIEGIGDGFVPLNLDLSVLTGVITTPTQEAVEWGKKLSQMEGLFCGISTGSNVAACIKLAKKHPELRTIVTMINDTGQRYFSTALCDNPKHFEVPAREHPMNERTINELDKYDKDWEIIT
jgi:cysteine synthase A